MEPTGTPPTFQPGFEFCYRHPNVGTGVHCTRCGKPICPDCMIPAPVGYQCPECVGQARKEFRSRAMTLGPRGGISMTKALLIAIGAMYAVEIVMGGAGAIWNVDGLTLYRLGAMFPPAIAAGQYWRLIASMFLHVGIWHIGMNAYALYLFGPLMESAYGRARFLALYLVTGFIASAASYAFGPALQLAAGASGAIFGVFGSFVAYHYLRRQYQLSRANLRTAMMMLALNAVFALAVPFIDWRAHLGGFISGFAGGYLLEAGSPGRSRRILTIAGLAAMTLVGVALVAWRTSTFTLPNIPLP